MRARRLIDALGNVDSRFLADLAPATVVRRKNHWPTAIAAAAVVALCVFGISRLPAPAPSPDDSTAPDLSNSADGNDPSNTELPDDGERPGGSDEVMTQPLQLDKGSLDTLFEELAAAGESTNEMLEQIKQGFPGVLLDYLMTDFMEGGLEGCEWNDGSTALLRFRVWYSMLEGDLIPSETETPLLYWQEWTDHTRRLLSLNGRKFMEDRPVVNRYLLLRYGDLSEETLDALFEELAAAGKTTNETLERLKEETPHVLLDYLMTDFMEGGLEGCELNDGSAGTLKWETWCRFKGIGDAIENAVETPQGDWLDWSEYAERLLRLNGVEFFDEESSPVTVRYAYLLGLE